ncbi:MAG: phospho-N-acetylmuramoyl-pentapeptide-transferase [Acidobacteriaceae bacterium]|nr:phospho-N-acetylmuramoyl-pentapeptide-transferase [Acidobacteriaceae bacterium]MBV9223024.1 phospho-N-acetylmuramoyl-pentapeptide-transferase [Acidobacteriaceae bacterium]MBV9305136.1 phospho-N-acetylmuramoyl-pentapeptide-transferase [Acidobacteriaceae bacterium]MBV9675782.1 phospho-N-acetylmuramoyl-pentapeptide-transferase [Acidobacteriaceae bacterium]MBV9939650.1 phospho-N-acetylmuramoyl-pentapeptide-transferase [Acidobacteriaceae bacterium]
MLYWLLFQVLHEYIPAFRVFGYVTTRTALASLTALALSLALGPSMIRKLRELSFGQHIREEGPQSHFKKAGTPTMGGLLIVTSIVLPTLLWADLRNPYVWVALLGLIGFGAIGFVDDYAKVAKKRNLGLTARQKFWAQVFCAMVVGFVLLLLHANQAYSTAINVPFFKQFKPDLLIESLTRNFWTYPLAFILFYFFIVFVMVGSSNAVNLTDGLDGLAIGLMVIASGAMTVLTYVSSHAKFSDYLDLAHLVRSQELTIFCASMFGASLGFLWYNCHPAQVFMGDVGSLALGGGLGVIAVLIKQEVLLVFIGGVFVLEALSVILQVGSYRLRGGKRIFKMAPIHHHFEALGWPESKIVVRFWIIGLVMALFALTTLKLR